MSWNAQRFARLVADQRRKGAVDDTALSMWMTTDALQRVNSQGGLIQTGRESLDIINDHLRRHSQVIVGLGTDPHWTGLTVTDENGHVLSRSGPPSTTPHIVTVQPLADLLAYAAEIELSSRVAQAEGDQERALGLAHASALMSQSIVGGWSWTTDGDTDAFWGVGADAAERLVDGSIQGTIAAALWLLSDPQVRDDAAITYESRSVEVPRRRGVPKHHTHVSVIDVRRRLSDEQGRGRGGDGSPVEHDHRWVTRGHWRNQPYGKGRLQRRRLWIEEHVCGPDDKPIRRDPRVYKIA